MGDSQTLRRLKMTVKTEGFKWLTEICLYCLRSPCLGAFIAAPSNPAQQVTVVEGNCWNRHPITTGFEVATHEMEFIHLNVSREAHAWGS